MIGGLPQQSYAVDILLGMIGMDVMQDVARQTVVQLNIIASFKD